MTTYSRQTNTEASQHPELHAVLHLQAPDKLQGIRSYREIDGHTKSLYRNPAM